MSSNSSAKRLSAAQLVGSGSPSAGTTQLVSGELIPRPNFTLGKSKARPNAANGLDESITPVYKLNQRPVSNRSHCQIHSYNEVYRQIMQRSVSGTSLDSEIAIDRTSDSRPVVVPSCRVFFPPMSNAHDNC